MELSKWVTSAILVLLIAAKAAGAPRIEERVVVRGGDGRAIQQAIDDVVPGGTVVIESGIYRIAEPINISKVVRIIGAGSGRDGRTELRATSPEVVEPLERASAVLNYTRGGGGRLEGVSIRSGQTGISLVDVADPLEIADVAVSGSARGLVLQSSATVQLTNSAIYKTLWHGIVIPAGASGFVDLKNIWISLTEGAGIYVGSGPPCVQIDHAFVSGASGPGVFVNGGCADIIEGWILANHDSGIKVINGTVSVNGTMVTDTQALSGGAGGAGIFVFLGTATILGAEIEFNDSWGLVVAGTNLTFGSLLSNCNGTLNQPEEIVVDTVPANFLGPGVPPQNTPSSVTVIGNENEILCGCGVPVQCLGVAGLGSFGSFPGP
ncbi:MAG TPA: hypothetical protein VLB32_02175 [Candidatus Acidoferrales bacterium]|nr:hypothetical protein [Candidatus Acidoferrales bacterium]